MNLIVSLEYRFESTPDAAVWTDTSYAYAFWRRYLEVFDSVSIIARVRQLYRVQPHALRADGERVKFVPIPYYLGPWQYLNKVFRLRRISREAIGPGDAIIMRVPSVIANSIERELSRNNHPFALEVVGDPYDVFAARAVRHPMRPFFRWWFVRRLREQCSRACAVSYVTKNALQRRYPASTGAYTTQYSSVELPREAFINKPRQYKTRKDPSTLIFVGSLAQLYKAPDVLLDAIRICLQKGVAINLNIVGDGKYRPKLQEHVATSALSDNVHFLGNLPSGFAIRSQLDRADLFVLPSRVDALPRALIEAMARGLPCLGSTVGGIPELLLPEEMVTPDNPQALANKIIEVIRDSDRMSRMSARNLERAKLYNESDLQKRRIQFYAFVKENTQKWLDESALQ